MNYICLYTRCLEIIETNLERRLETLKNALTVLQRIGQTCLFMEVYTIQFKFEIEVSSLYVRIVGIYNICSTLQTFVPSNTCVEVSVS